MPTCTSRNINIFQRCWQCQGAVATLLSNQFVALFPAKLLNSQLSSTRVTLVAECWVSKGGIFLDFHWGQQLNLSAKLLTIPSALMHLVCNELGFDAFCYIFYPGWRQLDVGGWARVTGGCYPPCRKCTQGHQGGVVLCLVLSYSALRWLQSINTS